MKKFAPMRTILITICLLIFVSGASAQRKWSGHANEAAPQPSYPPTAVCNDKTLWYRTEVKGACKDHKGVREWVSEQFITAGENPGRILVSETESIAPSNELALLPLNTNAPSLWLHPKVAPKKVYAFHPAYEPVSPFTEKHDKKLEKR